MEYLTFKVGIALKISEVSFQIKQQDAKHLYVFNVC